MQTPDVWLVRTEQRLWASGGRGQSDDCGHLVEEDRVVTIDIQLAAIFHSNEGCFLPTNPPWSI